MMAKKQKTNARVFFVIWFLFSASLIGALLYVYHQEQEFFQAHEESRSWQTQKAIDAALTAFYRSSDPQSEIEKIDQQILADPDNERFYLMKGKMYMSLQKGREAQAALTQAVERFPQSSYAHYLLAVCDGCLLREYQEAIPYITTSIQIAKRNKEERRYHLSSRFLRDMVSRKCDSRFLKRIKYE